MRKPARSSLARISGAWFCSIHEAAAPPSSTSRSLTRSSPAARPSANTSHTAWMCIPTMSWLQHLTVWPAPAGPTWTMVRPMPSSTGLARATASASPPTMIDSVPFSAPCGPPLTGASSIATPRSAIVSARRRAALGAIVLMSTRSRPGGGFSAKPPAASTTSSTCGVSGSIVTTTSARAAASATLAAGFAPCAARSATASRRTSCATTSCPALTRFTAIERPMTPSPMKPTTAIPHPQHQRRRPQAEIAAATGATDARGGVAELAGVGDRAAARADVLEHRDARVLRPHRVVAEAFQRVADIAGRGLDQAVVLRLLHQVGDERAGGVRVLRVAERHQREDEVELGRRAGRPERPEGVVDVVRHLHLVGARLAVDRHRVVGERDLPGEERLVVRGIVPGDRALDEARMERPRVVEGARRFGAVDRHRARLVDDLAAVAPEQPM